MDLLVLAKEPVPGRVKTRLTPPCDPAQAAALAEAALADTLEAALASGADRVVVALDGHPGLWCPAGVVLVDQGLGTLAERLATAWRNATGPALQIGMDTPQVSGADLDRAMGSLDSPGVDGVLGIAADGGWWTLGLACARDDVFAGVPTSRGDTGILQLRRLRSLGLRTRLLETRRDVDRWEDALAVAALAPGGAFARAVREVLREEAMTA